MKHRQTVEHFRADLLDWVEDNLRSFPWRDTTDPYEVLVAEILLQKTAAEKVEPIYTELLATYPSLNDLAEADHDRLGNIIYSLGFQNQRSNALIKIGQELRDSGVPQHFQDLLELPYVGRFAANATLCFAYDEPRPIVDANVVRVYNRIFDKEFDYRGEDTWSFAAAVLPADDARRYNLAILDFAATVCQPKVPVCSKCFFTDSCHYYQANQTG